VSPIGYEVAQESNHFKRGFLQIRVPLDQSPYLSQAVKIRIMEKGTRISKGNKVFVSCVSHDMKGI
jgi:hypothetical protein